MFGTTEKYYGKRVIQPLGRFARYYVIIKDVSFYIETDETSPTLISKFRNLFQVERLNEFWAFNKHYRKIANTILDDESNVVATLSSVGVKRHRSKLDYNKEYYNFIEVEK
jgi:hypothetical protein